jgi:L-asparaginase
LIGWRQAVPDTCEYSMAIRILATGGTFDKEYNERTGQLYFKDSHIAEMLRLGRSQVEVSIRTVMMIDSQSKSKKVKK